MVVAISVANQEALQVGKEELGLVEGRGGEGRGGEGRGGVEWSGRGREGGREKGV